MSSDLGLADYEYYFGPAGGVGGLDFGLNTNVDVMRIAGLHDLNVAISDLGYHGYDGDVPGIHLAEGRVVEITLHVRKGTQTDTQWRDLIDSVEGAFTVYKATQQELHWQYPGEEERFIRCRPTRRRRIVDPDSELGICEIQVQLHSPDPRVYTAAPLTDLNNTGTFSVTNNGSVNAYPIITFNRNTSLTRVRLQHNGTSQIIDVGGAGGLTGATTDVVCDMDRYIRGETGYVVYTDPGINHYGTWVVPRTPFYLEPGSNSLTLLNGSSVDIKFWHPRM